MGFLEALPVGGRVDITQRTQLGNALVSEIRQRVGERILGGPPDIGEWPRGTSGAKADEPVAAIGCRAECCVSVAESVECGGHIHGGSLGNVCANDCDAAARESAENAVHALSKIAGTLRQACNPQWQTEVCAVRGDGHNRAEPTVYGQPSQKPQQRPPMKA